MTKIKLLSHVLKFLLHGDIQDHSQSNQTPLRHPPGTLKTTFRHFPSLSSTGRKRGRLNSTVLINSWRLFWHNYPQGNIQDHWYTISTSSRYTPDIARTPPQKPQTSVIRTFNKDIHYPIKSVPEIFKCLQFMQRCVWCLENVWNCLRSVWSIWRVQKYSWKNSIR